MTDPTPPPSSKDAAKRRPAGNMLGAETSPYLLQHQDNPVHWRPWGPEALAEAQAENKPILLSIGYAACHWCHVMAHESFENEDIAALMNAHFVNIKVDREERPDIDDIYMTALHLLGEQGGWPLTMFLTPKGEPFWGGTYFPPKPRYGRPGFPTILQRIAEIFEREPDKIEENRRQIVAALQSHADAAFPGDLTPEILDQCAERALSNIDRNHGGFGGAPKFPQTGMLELLWRAYERSGNTQYKDAVETSLLMMCQGGIYDHLGGGFARYAVDARWLVPHFEKMLYDNAQLMQLMAMVWRRTGDPLLAARIGETADWVLREMIAEGGGFAASLDADSEGEEGKFYVWREEEIDEQLPAEDAALFKAAYNVLPDGNWEGVTILNRLRDLKPRPPAEETRLARARAHLLKVREGRIRPGWDDKILADWNGLMIAAMAEAGALFDRGDWLDAARTAYRFVRTRMTREEAPGVLRLLHTARGEKVHIAGMADDYANMAAAALQLYEITGETDYLDDAKGWSEGLHTHFRDAENGGYYFTADDAEALLTRFRSAADNPTPAANGVMVGVYAKLFALSGESVYRDRAESLVTAFAGEVRRNFFPLGSYLNGVDLFLDPLQIVVAREPGEAQGAALQAAAFAAPEVNRVLQPLPPGESLPAAHPAAGKGLVDGAPAAYVCRDNACSLPILDPIALAETLGAAPAARKTAPPTG